MGHPDQAHLAAQEPQREREEPLARLAREIRAYTNDEAVIDALAAAEMEAIEREDALRDRAIERTVMAQELEAERDELRAYFDWPWEFDAHVMAKADVCSLMAWNNDGPGDERVAETLRSLSANLGVIAQEVRRLRDGEAKTGQVRDEP